MSGSPPDLQVRSGSKSRLFNLSNWPRYPGGAIAGAVIGIAGVLLFFIGIPVLRSVLPAALVLAVALGALPSRGSNDRSR